MPVGSWRRCILIVVLITGCHEAPDPSRFVLAEGPCGGALLRRSDVSSLSRSESSDSGRLLGLLWTRYGAPHHRSDALFEYPIEDRERRVRFCVYSAQSGPAYGGVISREELRPSAEAFEALLADTEPSDCEVRFEAEVEYGGDEWRVGWHDGASFTEPVDPANNHPW